MSSKLINLLMAVVVAIVCGFFTGKYTPVLIAKFSPPEKKVAETKPEADVFEGVVIEEEGFSDSEEPEEDDTEQQDDGAGEIAVNESEGISEDEQVAGEQSTDSYVKEDQTLTLEDILEEDIPVIPAQQKVPKVRDKSYNTNIGRLAKNLIQKYDRELAARKGKTTNGYTNEDIFPDQWKKPAEIQKMLTERVMSKLGKADEEAVWKFLESQENRLDLARLTLIRKVGAIKMKEISELKMGTNLLFQLTSDLDWMTGLMYSGPTEKMDVALTYMVELYRSYMEDMGDPVVRRIAATTAMEFARENRSQKHMRERFAYYFTSYQAGKLNNLFDEMKYWETRIVTGCAASSSWGSPQSLKWQRDNVNLPVEGYPGAMGQVAYRLFNVAGDGVFNDACYTGPLKKYTDYATAWQHREIGGVCGALSHYGAFAALAHGIPAMPMGEPGHCAFTVRIGNEWVKSNSIYWQHTPGKLFWGVYAWDFLILQQDLYSDAHRTLVSDQLVALADLFAARKMTKSAFDCYEAAAETQPLNWPGIKAYASYLRQKDPTNKEKWGELHNRIVEGMAVKFHHAAATLLSRLVYPEFLKVVPDRRERNKLFASFFKKCETFGTNRWDINELLNAQMAGCTNNADKQNYMKEALAILMRKADYAPAVLAWGLDVIAALPEDDPSTEKLQEEFLELIISAMNRTRTTKKDQDNTWATLGEALYTAAKNDDTRTFSAIGRMAFRKCKKKFPKNKFKFRRFSGSVVSERGLLRTEVTLDPGAMKQCCLHWGVLQRHGGNIPVKMNPNGGMEVKLEQTSTINGVVVLFGKPWNGIHPLFIAVSNDGRNWSRPKCKVQVSGSVARFDFKESKPEARYVELRTEGAYQPETGPTVPMVGYYVYGKPIKTPKNTASDSKQSKK